MDQPYLNSMPVFSYKDHHNKTHFIRFDSIKQVSFLEKNERTDSQQRVSIYTSNNEKIAEFYGERALKFMEYYKMVFPVMDLGAE